MPAAAIVSWFGLFTVSSETANSTPGAGLGVADPDELLRDPSSGDGPHASDGGLVAGNAIAGRRCQRVDKSAFDDPQALSFPAVRRDSATHLLWIFGLKSQGRSRQQRQGDKGTQEQRATKTGRTSSGDQCAKGHGHVGFLSYN
jgi:hypothetical protein